MRVRGPLTLFRLQHVERKIDEKMQVLEIDGGHFEALNCRATNLLLEGCLHESVAEIHKV